MNGNKEMTYLSDIRDSQIVTIVSITGGRMATKRLADLGLAAGTTIKVLRGSFFSGPIEIEVSGAKLALGRGLASKIMVELR